MEISLIELGTFVAGKSPKCTAKIISRKKLGEMKKDMHFYHMNERKDYLAHRKV